MSAMYCHCTRSTPKPRFPWFPVQEWPRTEILLGSIWMSVRHRWPLLVWCVYCNAPLHPTKPHTPPKAPTKRNPSCVRWLKSDQTDLSWMTPFWASNFYNVHNAQLNKQTKNKVIRRFASVLLHFFFFFSSFCPTKLSYPFQFLCITIVFADALCIWSGDSPDHHLGSESSGCSCHECMVRVCARVCACVAPMSFPQSHPPTGTIVSPYPIKTIAKTGIQTSARAQVRVCMCSRAHKPAYTDQCTQMYGPVHTLGSERVISKSILWEF